MEKIIEVIDVSKKFKNQLILHNINLEIIEGKITGIVGTNGSGKTVLLKILAGLYFPDSGKVDYHKYTIYNDYGILIDNGFNANETGFNNLKDIAILKNIVKDDDIFRILDYVHLNPADKTKYKNYSTGMKQKLRLAQALMEKPKVLILDEPFNGLDEQSVQYFRNIFKELNKDGVTIIITSHYKEDIEMLCDTVYKVNDGSIKNITI